MKAAHFMSMFSSAGNSGGFAPRQPSVNPNASAADRGLTVNPKKASQLLATKSEFEMFLAIGRPVYSIASELDADQWDAEHRLQQRILDHNTSLDMEPKCEPGDEHGAHELMEDDGEMERRTR